MCRWRPDRTPGEIWDDLAKENAISAILYHSTEPWFHESGKLLAEALYRIMASLKIDASRISLLDLGGGIGRIAEYLAPKVKQYHLLDASAEMIKQARPYLQGINNVSFYVGDGFTLTGIPDNSIDFCFSFIVLQHNDREVTVHYLMDLKRVLKDGSYALLHVPMMCYPTRFEEAARGDWPANFRRWYPGEFLEVVTRLGYGVVAGDCEAGQFILTKAPTIQWLKEGMDVGEVVTEAATQ